MKFYLQLSLLALLATNLVFSDSDSTKSSTDSSKDSKSTDAKKYGTIIGIDLGTTYSCVGVYKNGRVEIIPNDQGNRITPSYVAFTPDTGERLIGDSAKNQLTLNPRNTIFDVKRLIGREFSEKVVQDDLKLWPFEITNRNNKPYVQVKVGEENKQFAPEEVSEFVLEITKILLQHCI